MMSDEVSEIDGPHFSDTDPSEPPSIYSDEAELVPLTADGHIDAVRAFNLRRTRRARHLTIWGLTGLIFYNICGGPFGIEVAVKFGSPMFTILSFVGIAVVRSLPEALITAELGTAMPHNAGQALWIAAAFGDRLGWVSGFIAWLCQIVDCGVFPSLLVTYIHQMVKAWSSHGHADVALHPAIEYSILFGLPTVLTAMNLAGIRTVAQWLVATMVVILIPFLVMLALSIPWSTPSNWAITHNPGQDVVNWIGCLNIVFWNSNNWDTIASVSGEIRHPQRILPRAITWSLLLVTITYVIPLMNAIAVGDANDFKNWNSGQFVQTAWRVGGRGLAVVVTIGSVLSFVGVFQSTLVAAVYHLEGYADIGWTPEILAKRLPGTGSPWVSLLICWFLIMIISACPFISVINFCNVLYSALCISEMVAFLYLRKYYPNLHRPYRVPIHNMKALIILLLPTIIFGLVIIFGPLFYGDWIEVTAGLGCIAFAFIGQMLMECLRDRKLAKFARLPPQALGERFGNICQQAMSSVSVVVEGDPQIISDEQVLSGH